MLVDSGGVARWVDLGIAGPDPEDEAEAGASAETSTGEHGTVLTADVPGDVFRFGEMLREMLIGEVEELGSPVADGGDLSAPGAIAEIISTCRHEDPRLRYASAGEILSALHGLD